MKKHLLLLLFLVGCSIVPLREISGYVPMQMVGGFFHQKAILSGYVVTGDLFNQISSDQEGNRWQGPFSFHLVGKKSGKLWVHTPGGDSLRVVYTYKNKYDSLHFLLIGWGLKVTEAHLLLSIDWKGDSLKGSVDLLDSSDHIFRFKDQEMRLSIADTTMDTSKLVWTRYHLYSQGVEATMLKATPDLGAKEREGTWISIPKEDEFPNAPIFAALFFVYSLLPLAEPYALNR